jgi:hypothetical protein
MTITPVSLLAGSSGPFFFFPDPGFFPVLFFLPLHERSLEKFLIVISLAQAMCTVTVLHETTQDKHDQTELCTFYQGQRECVFQTSYRFLHGLAAVNYEATNM